MTRAKDISKILTDADISGNIDVDGVTNLDVVDIDGAVDMASTLTVGGAVTINNGELKVTSATGDNADKKAHFTTAHYDTDEENFGGLILQSSNGDNLVDVGGSQSGFNSATKIRFFTGANATTVTGTERARINTEGNILVGLTSRLFYNHTGTINVNGDGDAGIKVNRSSDTGNFIAMGQNGTQKGQIGSDSSSNMFFTCQRGAGISVSDQELIPTNASGALTDNFMDVGHPSYRFDDVRATNGTIQTSDRNDKQDIEELTDAEKRVAVVAKGLMRKFRWKDNVTEKGDKARTHFGIIAQDLQDAFTAESLDASKYAMFCSDTWWQKEIPIDAVKAVDEVKDEEGNITTHAVEAKDAYIQIDVKDEATTGYTEKTRLGVRYSELLAFIISAI